MTDTSTAASGNIRGNEPENVTVIVLFPCSDVGRMCTGREYWIDTGW